MLCNYGDPCRHIIARGTDATDVVINRKQIHDTKHEKAYVTFVLYQDEVNVVVVLFARSDKLKFNMLLVTTTAVGYKILEMAKLTSTNP